jgi:putative membrane protein
MTNKSVIAVGFAAALMLGTVAQAQTSMQNGAHPSNRSMSPQGQMAPQGQNAQKLSKADQAFLKEAIETDMAEVQMGQLAQQKGQSQDVKQLGQAMQQDHSKNLQQAQQLAQQNGMTPPSAPNAKQKQMHDSMSKMSGDKFDRQFARDMVKGHKQALSKFEKEAKGKGPLALYAQQTVPALQKHLQMAQDIAEKGAAVGSGSKMR